MNASPVVDTREITYRVFAAEFDDVSLLYSENDEERAPNHVIAPTGMRLNRTFIADILTEVEHVSDEMLHGRITDPAGTFVTYAGQYQPEPMAHLDAMTPLAFVSLTGKARTHEPGDTDVVYSSVRPESVNTVDADIRNRWIVSAAEAMPRHIAVFDEVLSVPYRGDGLTRALEVRGVDSTLAAGAPRAIDHYGMIRTYLEALHEIAVQTLKLAADDHDQVDPLDVAPGDGGGAVLGPLPELNLESAADADIEVGETDAGEIEAGVGESESESGFKPAAALDSELELGDGVEPEVAESESESEPIAKPDPESGPASDPEPVATEATAVAEDQPGASESEPASESSMTVDSEPEPEPAAEPESEPAAEPDLTPGPELEPVIDSPNTESEPDFDDGAPGDFEDGAPNASTTDASSLDDPGNETLGDPDDSFNDPNPEAGDSTDSTGPASANADDSVDPDRIYGLDEDERTEIKSEFGTEFTPGVDVDPASEADTGVPDVDDLTEQLEDESAATAESGLESAVTAAGPEPAVDPEPEPAPDTVSDGGRGEVDVDPNVDESAEGIDLESAVADAMDDLDDGDGATCDEVVAVIIDEHGTDPGAIEGVIQEALLDGRCYEPQDGALRAI